MSNGLFGYVINIHTERRMTVSVRDRFITINLCRLMVTNLHMKPANSERETIRLQKITHLLMHNTNTSSSPSGNSHTHPVRNPISL